MVGVRIHKGLHTQGGYSPGIFPSTIHMRGTSIFQVNIPSKLNDLRNSNHSQGVNLVQEKNVFLVHTKVFGPCNHTP